LKATVLYNYTEYNSIATHQTRRLASHYCCFLQYYCRQEPRIWPSEGRHRQVSSAPRSHHLHQP
ncbi:hypothetical protein GBAR_LOCUS24336, partial [Geodia barretti]